MPSPFILNFSQIRMADVAKVGGKNASLGELFHALNSEVGVLDGFAITTEAYWHLLKESDLAAKLEKAFAGLVPEDVENLSARGSAVRSLILATPLPADLNAAIIDGYKALIERIGYEPGLAVRSSASAEDLPEASFAGAAETFLNVRGEHALLTAVHQCFASLFTDRAISYRARQGYPPLNVALSVGVMPMVRSDKACAGVMFTLDTESGFPDVVTINGAYGLGEFVVQGTVTPDEWTVFKPTLLKGFEPIVSRSIGTKNARLVYGDGTRSTRTEPTPMRERERFCLTDAEVIQLAKWACRIEQHYSDLAGHRQPMDIEWAKDGLNNQLYIVQARPETVHSQKRHAKSAQVYRLTAAHGDALVKGQAVGERIGSGKARVISDITLLNEVQEGDILIAPSTSPDWEPVMRRVAGIVTDQGGRTAHAAIVSREFGIPCIVGTGNATATIRSGQEVTVCCTEGSEGHVYPGLVPFTIEEITETELPEMRTKIMLIVGNPSKAFSLASTPNDGVGLARIEFIIANHIGIHPMALASPGAIRDSKVAAQIHHRIGNQSPTEFFVGRLSEGVSRLASAFYPKPVIVRMSDFKTNEYEDLLGGAAFEQQEENPMLGFRGAARYYNPRYAAGFALECEALARVRNQCGLTNVKVMVPFCRTVDEGRKVIAIMAEHGLKQGENGLEIYVMCELPANVVLADEFLKIFDGYSIGSNDLTQLTLGLDRDSAVVAHLFDENNPAVRAMIAMAIKSAKTAGKPIGICGQGPSDSPEFAEWLVQQGITSISLSPDTVFQTAMHIAFVEEQERAKK
jgi:pyruvate,water dikinase